MAWVPNLCPVTGYPDEGFLLLAVFLGNCWDGRPSSNLIMSTLIFFFLNYYSFIVLQSKLLTA
jgi:hypothetical protein